MELKESSSSTYTLGEGIRLSDTLVSFVISGGDEATKENEVGRREEIMTGMGGK